MLKYCGIIISMKLIKPFIVIFIFSFLVINWSDVSWVFNYRFILDTASGFFEGVEETNIVDDNNFKYTEKGNSIEISKLNLEVPLIIGKNTIKSTLEGQLRKGVVYFPSSALPGQNGETIVLGHSARPSWPETNYNWVFSELNQLKIGDKIVINFNHREYTYIVKSTYFINRGDEIQNDLTKSDNMLLLISCWPPGQDIQRIVVQAQLI